jgi:hypothetical protein
VTTGRNAKIKNIFSKLNERLRGLLGKDKSPKSNDNDAVKESFSRRATDAAKTGKPGSFRRGTTGKGSSPSAGSSPAKRIGTS